MALGDVDLNKKRQKLQLFLAKPNREIIAKLTDVYNIVHLLKLGNLNELAFSLPYEKDIHNVLSRTPYIDLIKEHYLIKGILGSEEEWYLITKLNKQMNDTDELGVQCFSLGYELSKKRIRDYKVESYNCTSVLTNILASTNWTIGSVDSYFNYIYRSFDISSKTVLDALFETAETFGGTVTFDTVNRKINIYKPENIGQDKGLKISYGHYLQSLNKESNTDEICTRYYPYGKDNLTITTVNPTGEPFIDDFSHFLYPFLRDAQRNVIKSSDYMTDELCHAILDYNDKLKGKLPVEDMSEVGTTTTNIKIANHSLVSGDYIVNKNRGNEKRKVTVIDSDNITVTAITDQTNGDIIETYKDGTFGKLFFNKEDKQFELTTKKNELSTLNNQKTIILDNVALQQETSTITNYDFTYNGSTTTKATNVDINLKYAVMCKVSSTINLTVKLDGVTKILSDDTWVILGKVSSLTSTSVEISGASTNENVKIVVVKITDSEYTTSGNETAILDNYNLDYKESQITSKQTEIDVKNTEIASVDSQITTLRTDVSMSTNFTSAQITELNDFIFGQEWQDQNYTNALDLYYEAKKKLSEINTPRILVEIDIVNFLECVEEQRNWGKLVLGDTITIKYEKLNINVQAKIVEIEYNHEDGSINLTISNLKDIETIEQKFINSFYKTQDVEKQVKNKKAQWDEIAYNFNNRNDRVSITPSNPIIANDGTVIDHTLNDDGSADISFEWSYTKYIGTNEEYNIDGFIIYVHSQPKENIDGYTFGSTVSKDQTYTVSADKRAFIIQGVAANRNYTFGIQAYRSVDDDISSDGVLVSQIVKSTYPGENPYLPTANVAFNGDISGTIGGISTDDFVNDDKLIPTEKSSLKTEWDSIVAEKSIIFDQANTYIVVTTGYINAFNTLGTYLNGGTVLPSDTTTPSMLSDLTTTSDLGISGGSTLRVNLKNYYNEKALITKSITDSINGTLSDIANDNKLTASEKQAIKKEWDIIAGEKPIILLQASTYSVSSVTYVDAFNNLGTYLNNDVAWTEGTTPSLLSDLTNTINIDGVTFRTNFKNYYDAKTSLQKVITDQAKTLADNAQTTANNAYNGIKYSLLNNTTPKAPTKNTSFGGNGDGVTWDDNQDGTVDIGIGWNFPNPTNSTPTITEAIKNQFINGFIIQWRPVTNPISEWRLEYAESDDRYYIIKGVPLLGGSGTNKYDIEVYSYRIVDSSIVTKGVLYSALDTITPSQWLNYDIATDKKFDGQLTPTSLIGSTQAGTVVSEANQAYTGTSTYRDATSPDGVFITNPITASINTDGSCDLILEWTYSEGTYRADGFIIAYETGENATVSTSSPSFQQDKTTSKFILTGVAVDKFHNFRIYEYRSTNTGLSVGSLFPLDSSWSNIQVATAPNYTGNINGTDAVTVVGDSSSGKTAYDQTANSIRNSNIIPDPTIASDGTAIDHVGASGSGTLNTDGSVDISFEWIYTESSTSPINGFGIVVYSDSINTAHTPNLTTDTVYYVDKTTRAFILNGVPANKYYTFAVFAYRYVDTAINSQGIIRSNTVKSTLSSENPYQPSSSVAFGGDITGTVDGVAAGKANNNPATVIVADQGTTLNYKQADFLVPLGSTSAQIAINDAINILPLISIASGTSGQTGTSTTIYLHNQSKASDDEYNGLTIEITGGTGTGQTRTISDYDGTNNVATVSSNWTTIPDITSVYIIKSKVGKVLLLEGTYIIDAPIKLPSNATLEGIGTGTIIKIKDNSVTSTFTAVITNSSVYGNANININNLTIDGNKSNQPDGFVTGNLYRGVYLNYAKNSTVNKIISKNSYEGIEVEYSDNIIITDNVCENNFDGIETYKSNNNNISNNICSNNGSGIWVMSGKNNTISGNTCNNNSNSGIALRSDYATYNIYNTVSGNTCNNNKRNGLYIVGGQNNTISGNAISNSKEHGIYMTTENSVITGNICSSNGQGILNTYSNIFLENASFNNIQSNICRLEEFHSGTAIGGSITSIQLATTASSVDDYYNDMLIEITGGTAKGQKIKVNDYSGYLKTVYATSPYFSSPYPDSTSQYRILKPSKYGIDISNSLCEGNTVTNNDLYVSGITGSINDAGTSTTTTSGNKL